MDTTSLIGKRFGRLVVLEYSHFLYNGSDKAKRTGISYFWKCQCDCGNITYVNRQSLIIGRTRSCGCLRSEKLRERQLNKNKRTGFVTKF